MYLYFDSQGKLRELVNDEPIRQGSAENSFYIYIEGVSVENGVYPLPHYYSAVNLSYLLVGDNDKITYTDLIDYLEENVVIKEIPYNKKRDLKYFEYGKKYEFWKIEVPEELTLSNSGTVSCSVSLYPGAKVLGLILFEIEQGAMLKTVPLDYAQYNYLLEKFSDKLEKIDSILKRRILGDISGYDEGQSIYVKNDGTAILYEVVIRNGIKTVDVIFDFNAHYTKSELDIKFNNKVSKIYSGNKLYGTNEFGDDTTYNVGTDINPNFVPKRDSNGQIKVPTNPTSDNDAISKAHLEKRINEENGYRLTKNADGDRFDTFAELESATTFYYAGEVRIPTKNDIATVVSDENHDGSTTRYFYAGTTYPDGIWELDEIINERPFTDEELDALNSGINSDKVAQYDGYETGKQDTISDLTDIRNNAQAGKNASDNLVNYRTKQAQDLIDNSIRYDISQIREIAEGKSNTLVFGNETADFEIVKQKVVSGEYAGVRKVSPYGDTDDTTYGFIEGDYDNFLFAYNDFKTTQASVRFTFDPKKYLFKETQDSEGNKWFDLYLLYYDDRCVKVGDTIKFKESDMPDFWVSDVNPNFIEFTACEGKQNFYNKQESDTRYAQVHEENHFTEKQRFENGININQIEDLDGNLQIGIEQLFDAVGDTLINTTSTSYSGGFLNSNHYIFRQPLTSLTISALESLSATGLKEWKITFNPSSTFALNFPTSGKYQFADGEPIWDSTYEYILVIEKSAYADDKYNVFVVSCEV